MQSPNNILLEPWEEVSALPAGKTTISEDDWEEIWPGGSIDLHSIGKAQSPGSTITDIPKALVRGLDVTGESIGGAMKMLHIPGGEFVKELYGKRAERPEIARPQYLAEGTVVEHPERLADARWWVNLLGENLPNMALMIAPGAGAYRFGRGIGLGLKSAARLATLGGATGAFAIEAGAAYNDAKEQMQQMGYKEEEADRIATIEGFIVGTVNSLLEVAPFTILLKNPGGKKLLSRIIRQGLWEGGTEGVQENVNMIAEQLGHKPDTNLKQWIGRTVESGLAGLVLGGGAGIFEGAEGISKKSPAIEAEQPTVDILTDEKKERVLSSAIIDAYNKGKLTTPDLETIKNNPTTPKNVVKQIDKILANAKLNTEPIDILDLGKPIRTGKDIETGMTRLGTGLKMPGPYPELAGKSAEESARVFEDVIGREEELRRSPLGVTGLKTQLEQKEEESKVRGVGGLAPYLSDYVTQFKQGKPGQRVKSEDYLGKGEEWQGYAATYPDWFRDQGWTAKKAIKALEHGLTGGLFTDINREERDIWNAALDAAKEESTRDIIEYAKLVEEAPEEIRELEDYDYQQMIEVLTDEGYSTREIEDSATRYRKPIQAKVISEIAGEQGISEEEFASILAREKIDLGTVWNEAIDAKEIDRIQKQYLQESDEWEDITDAERIREDERRNIRPEGGELEQEAQKGQYVEGYKGPSIQERPRKSREDQQLEPGKPARGERELIDQAAQEAETEPTEAQKKAGNYKKGHVNIQGLDISIENPKGSERSGVDRQGNPWKIELKHHYGYIRRTEGPDGDQVDAFIGPNPESDKVYIVDQIDPYSKTFDEHKVMLGFNTEKQARVGYLANYKRGWRGLGAITEMSMDEFKTWLKDGDQHRAISDLKETQNILAKGLPERKPGQGYTPSEEISAPAEEYPTGVSPFQQIANFIKENLKIDHKVDWKLLFKRADKAFGGTQAEGTYTPKDAYDAMELGVNQYLQENPDILPTEKDVHNAGQYVKVLKGVISKIPTQTRRTEESDEFQQFSTPPPFAYVVAWVANLNENDTVLEPSAGTGNIAVMAKNAGAKVIVNELSDRRLNILKAIGFDQYFTEDAEQINNILPKDIKPTVVLMNPPFSASAGRIQGLRNTKIGARHVEQALLRLEDGGRLVAIVGKGMSEKEAGFRKWWDKIKKDYNVRANIRVHGKEYYKYGTGFDNQLVIIDKTGPTEYDTLTGAVEKIEDLLPLIEGIRNDRAEQRARQPGGIEGIEKGERGAGPEPVIQPAIGEVGRGEREGRRPPRIGREPGQTSFLGTTRVYEGAPPKRGGGPGGPTEPGRRPERPVTGGAERAPEPTQLPTGYTAGIPTTERPAEQIPITEATPDQLLDLFDKAAGIKKEKAAPIKERQAKEEITSAIDSFFKGERKLTTENRKKLEDRLLRINKSLKAGIVSDDAIETVKQRKAEIESILAEKPTPKAKAKETGEHLKNIAQGIKDINKILGEEGAFSFNEIKDDDPKWQQIKPILADMWNEAVAAGQSAAEFVDIVLKGLGTKGRGYFEKFVREEINKEKGTGVLIVGGLPETDKAKAEKVEIEAKKKENAGEFSDDIYASYKPEKVVIPGAVPHPTPLVQSAAMSAVEPPDPVYNPTLPESSIKGGKISDIQLEAIVYAGQAHNQILPGEKKIRRGFFIGDGTGVGKGREIAGIIWDNWNKGRKKAVWISKNKELFRDAERDVEDSGWSKSRLFNYNKMKAADTISIKEGILFSSYDTIWRKPQGTKEVPNPKSRLDRIVDWLGEDFDGVIAFDESHSMENAVSIKGDRGTSEPSKRALAGVELQDRLPNARVIYVSATGATNVINLAYATRLGLWGEGTPFSSRESFVNEISKGGIAAMELIAQNLKAMGSYVARSLSYDGVGYDRIVHELSPQQVDNYNTLADAWQMVLRNIEEAMGITGVSDEFTGRNLNGQAAAAAKSQFWGAHQRFFNQVLTSMQLPSALDKIREDLKKGYSVVIQLVNTNEAIQNRAFAKLEEEESYEDLDMSPMDILMTYVERSYPVQQFEEFMDDNGNVKSRPVVDSKGNAVLNAQAVEMRERLLDELGSLRKNVVDNPLDQIIDEFGEKEVAEITGRSRRLVWKDTEQGRKKVLEKRTDRMRNADIEAYRNDEKRMLIFSEKGGTGASYHSDLGFKNQRKRSHYLLQPGWIANRAVQGLGRTHRSNEAQPPFYHLCCTNLNAQKRFISSIARRLDQLGALTKGQRQTGSQGIFNAKDNLESDYAREALINFYKDLINYKVPGITVAEYEEKTGLKLTNEQGQIRSKLPTIKDFLNRLLSLNTDVMNTVYDAFDQRLESIVEAHVRAGTLDQGLETLKGDSIVKAHQETVFTDPLTGVETKYIQLNVTTPAIRMNWGDAKKWAIDGFYKNVKSGKVWSAQKGLVTNRQLGISDYAIQLYSPAYSYQTRDEVDINNSKKWQKLTEDEARELWKEQADKLPKTITRKEHLISGSILPIWDRLIGHPRIMRVQTDQGEQLIGRLIAPRDLDQTLKNMGARGVKIEATAQEVFDNILEQNAKVTLANDWRIERRRVSGDERIEVIGPKYSDYNLYKQYGLMSERIQFVTRYFIPTTDKGVQLIDRIMKYSPVTSLDIAAVGDVDAAKNRVLSKLKDERGAISFKKVQSDGALYDDLITLGRHYYDQGYQKYSEFANQFKTALGDVWETIRNVIKYIWNDVKTRLKEERGSFGGRLYAKTADIPALVKAKQMTEEGKSEREIWKETGWMKGAEGDWRFEIDDSGANLTINKDEIITDMPYFLSGVLNHQKLFEAYPELKNYKVVFKNKTGGRFDGYSKEVEVGVKGLADIPGTLFHEIQHAIQEIEGFAVGGSPEDFPSTKVNNFNDRNKAQEFIDNLPEDIKKNARLVRSEISNSFKVYVDEPLGFDSRERYRRLAGEVEAREVATRVNLTEDQRRAMTPYAGEGGIPRDQWIIKKGEGTSFSIEKQKPVTAEKDPTKEWAENWIDGILKKDSSDRAKEVKKNQNYFDKGQYAKDTADTAKAFVKVNKKGWIKGKPDTTILERILQSPEFYFEEVPAAWRTFNASLERSDDYNLYYNKLTENDALLTTIKQFMKDRPKEYNKLAQIITKADMNKINWTADALRKRHQLSDQAINAWIAFRQLMNNGFDMLYAEMQKIIEEHEKAGLPLPEIATFDGDKRVKVNLKVALAQMGQMRGYYAPRSRRAGRWMLIAKQKDKNPILEFFDTKTFANLRGNALEKEGYKVSKKASSKTPEDVFEMAGRTIGLQAMINQALDRAIGEEGPPRLLDFGLEGIRRGVGVPGRHMDFIVRGPTSKKMNEVMKSLGGRYYSSARGEAKAWHFADPPMDIEFRVTRALAASAGIPGVAETDLLFAHALATEVANIVKGRGFRSSMIRRTKETGTDVWVGYETDPLKAASMYVTGLSAGLAKKNMASKMVRAITGTDIEAEDFESFEDYLDAVKERRIDPENQRNIFHDTKVYMEEMLRNQEFADRIIGTIKGITVLKYLGGRLAAPLVNLTALATSVPASMNGYAKVPLSKVPVYLGRAMDAYYQYRWGDRNSLDPDVIAMFDHIHDKGWHTAQYNLEALAVLRSKVGSSYEKLINLSMFLFGATEQLNRISTIAGTYMAIKDQEGSDFVHDQAIKTAKKTSDRSHGVYGKATLPYIAQGKNPFAMAAKCFYVFSKFSHTYLQNMYELGFKQENRKALLYMAMAPAILSGGAAIPIVGPAVMWALGKLIRDGDQPEEGEEAFYAWLEDNLGNMTSDFARFGLVGLGGRGISLKGSLQIDIEGSIPENIPELLGAPGNVFTDVWQGGKSILKGDIYRGLERMGPRFTGSIMQGMREYRYGVTTQRNVPKLLDGKQMQPDFIDTVLRSLNFNPAHIAEQKEKKWAQTKLIKKYQDQRTDIYTRIRSFYQKPALERTKNELAEIMADIKEYNQEIANRKLYKIKGISIITKRSIAQSIRLNR